MQKLSAQLKKEGELMLEVDKNQYKEIFENIKNEILKSQYKAMQVVNRELVFMYLNIGKIIL